MSNNGKKYTIIGIIALVVLASICFGVYSFAVSFYQGYKAALVGQQTGGGDGGGGVLETWPTEATVAISEPEDPLSLQSPKVESTLLVMPFKRNGVYTSDYDQDRLNIELHWIYNTPGSFGVINTDTIKNKMLYMHLYDPDGEIVPDPEIEKTVIEYTGATHILSGNRVEVDGGYEYHLRFFGPTFDEERTITIESGHQGILVEQASQWMVESLDFTFPQEYVDRLTKSPYGPFQSIDDGFGEIGSQETPLDDPSWKEHLDIADDFPIWQVVAMNAAVNQQDYSYIREATEDPVPQNSSFIDRFVRAKGLYFVSPAEKAAAFHDYSILLLEHPGKQMASVRLFFQRTEQQQRRHQYLKLIDAWYERTPKTYMNDDLYGQFLIKSAWGFRGGDYAHKVPPAAWSHFHTNINKASEKFIGIINGMHPLPWTATTYITTLGAGASNTNDTPGMIASEVSNYYPDYFYHWNQAIHFTRPRWGGSHQQAMAIIDEAISKASKNNPTTFLLIPNYHVMEAVSAYSDRDLYHRVENYLDDFPAAKKQFLDGIEQLKKREPKDKGYAFAYMLAIMLDDRDLQTAIYRENPDVYTEYVYSCYDIYRPKLMFYAFFDALSEMHLDNASAMWEDIHEFDQHDGQTAFYQPDDRSMTHAYAMAIANDKQGTLDTLNSYPRLRRTRTVNYVTNKVMVDAVTQEDLSLLESNLVSYEKNNKRNYIYSHLILGAGYSLLGNQEKALAFLEAYRQLEDEELDRFDQRVIQMIEEEQRFHDPSDS